MSWKWTGRLAGLMAAFVVVAVGGAAQADQATSELAELIKPLLLPPSNDVSGGAWEDLDANRAIRWGAGPVMLSKPSPDGNYFARPGQATLAGRPLNVIAAGARSMVFSYYFRAPAPPAPADTLVAAFGQAGYRIAPVRCAKAPGAAAPKQWYRLSLPRKNPAFLYAGPLQSGGGGYTLYLTDLPAMTQADAAAYTDNCPGTAPGGRAASAAMGQDGIAAAIEALLRPAGAPAPLPWQSLASLPAIKWKALPPMKMAYPWTDSGQDLNPRLLEGEFRSATTRMMATATGDDRGANRFYLRDGQNLPRGAVFARLARDGYQITALRCGKVYTETSQAWFRISGPGKQPAVLYRAQHRSDRILSEDYGLWLDNTLPRAEPGQTPAAGGQCPG
ncbi:MAG: hypothetical protein JWQ29_813 [Phenylobacterium sp.]|nr:hypothetical protein [Phenylobacterium sp.]